MNPPFPPYTMAMLRQRFPDMPEVHQRIIHIQQIMERSPTELRPQDPVISRATAYRLRQRWLTDGIDGILPLPLRPKRQKTLSVDMIRGWLKALRITSFLKVGQDRGVTHWLGHIRDPYARGIALMQYLIRQVDQIIATDDTWQAIRPTLVQTIIEGTPVADSATQIGYSERTLYRMIRQVLDRLIIDAKATLPLSYPHWPWETHVPSCSLIGRSVLMNQIQTMVQQHNVCAIVGLQGVGKTAIAATMAHVWHQAGWRIVWASTPITADGISALLDQLSPILGLAAPISSPDIFLPPDVQQVAFRQALSQFPTLLIIDNIHMSDNDPVVRQWIETLIVHQTPLRVLLVGHWCPFPTIPAIPIDGLSVQATTELLTILSQDELTDRWHECFAMSHGIPALIHMFARTRTTPSLAGYEDPYLTEIFQALPWAYQRIVVAISFWEGEALTWSHPFIVWLNGDPSIWQVLTTRRMLIQEHGTIAIHRMLKPHLRGSVAASRWLSICQSLEVIAKTYQWDDLIWRLFVEQHQHDQAWAMSITAARTAQTQGLLPRARQWWERAEQLVSQEHAPMHWWNARMNHVYCALMEPNLLQAQTLLTNLPTPTNPQIHWRLAAASFCAAYLMRDDGDANRLLQEEPLIHPCPLPPDHEEASYFKIAYSGFLRIQGDHHTAYHWIDTISVATIPIPQWCYLLARIAIALAKERQDHEGLIHWLHYRMRLTTVMDSPYGRCVNAIEAIATACDREQFHRAARLITATRRLLNSHWITLHVRLTMYDAHVTLMQGRWRSAVLRITELRALGMIYGPSALAYADHLEWSLWITLGAWSLVEQALDHVLTGMYETLMHQDYTRALLWRVGVALEKHDHEAIATWMPQAMRILRHQRSNVLLAALRPLWAQYCAIQQQWEKAARHARRHAQTMQITQPIQYCLAWADVAWYLLQAGMTEHAACISEPMMARFEETQESVVQSSVLWYIHASILDAIGDHTTAQIAWQRAFIHVQQQIRRLPAGYSRTSFIAHPDIQAVILHHQESVGDFE